jgi:alanine dehydrogenase
MRPGEKGSFIYISDELVRQHLSLSEAIEIVKSVYRLHGLNEAWVSNPSAMFLTGIKDDKFFYKVKGACIPSKEVAGFRIIGNAAPESSSEEPWTYRYCYLADPRTAMPLAVIDEFYQSALRTGVTGAVALSLFGRKDSSVLAIVGAGTIARHVMETLTRFFSLKEVRVSTKNKVSREAFAGDIEAQLSLRAEAVVTPEEAVRGADLVVTITDADTALVSAEWLSPGTTVCSMGNNQELEPKVFYEADKFFIDEWGFCMDVGDVHAWVTKGYLKEAEIREKLNGTIGEVMAGRKQGRENEREKILVIPQGMAACDLAFARFVYEKLKNSELVQRIYM